MSTSSSVVILRIVFGLLVFSECVQAAPIISFSTNRGGFNLKINPLAPLFRGKGGAQPGSGGEERLTDADLLRSGPAQEVQSSFRIDPRWREWSSNAVILIDASRHGWDSGDFLEWQRSEFKLLYARTFAKYDQEHFGTNSPVAKDLERARAAREVLVRQRKVQEDFQNSISVAKFDKMIGAKDSEIRQIQELASPLSPNEARVLLGQELLIGHRTLLDPTVIFDVAFAQSNWKPLPPDDTTIQSLVSYREQLANMASNGKTPPDVLKKALEQNSQLKQIQDDLLAGRSVQARKVALMVWASFLE